MMDNQLIEITQLAVNGLSIGAIYSLVALGLVLTYKATEVLNFAYGDLLTLAAFSGWAVISVFQLPFWLAAIMVVALLAIASYVLEAQVIRRVIGQPHFASVMLTISLGFIIRGLVSMGFGTESQTFTTPWSGQLSNFGAIVIADLNVAIIVVCATTATALLLSLAKTKPGLAIQAASQNQLAAYLMGIPVKRFNSLVWAVCGAIAALCALLLAPITLVDISLWSVVLKGLAALVLGGFGSVQGAIAGGLVLGLLEQFSGVYLPDGFKDGVADTVLIAVLMFYPRGIMGDAHGRRV